MALVESASIYVGFGDSAKRRSEFAVRTTVAAAKAYVAAADQTARDATTVGTLITATKVLSTLTPFNEGVRFGVLDDAADFPASGAGLLRGNKLTVSYTGSGRAFVVSIPGRDNSVLTLDGITAVRVEAEELDDFATAFNAVARDINGNAATFSGATVND